MVGMCFSGRSTDPRPEAYAADSNPAGSIQGSPPMAVGAPAGDQAADFHLDFATGATYNDEDFGRRPELFFRSLGISQMCNILSGTLGTSGRVTQVHGCRLSHSDMIFYILARPTTPTLCW